MEFFTYLWLPVVISGVVLFFASFVAWTLAPHHKSDWNQTPTEDELMRAVSELNLKPGNYLFPFAVHGCDAQSPAFQEKYNRGPRGVLSLWPVANMGLNLSWTFLYFLITAAMIAYVGYVAMGRGQPGMHVFRVVGTIGILTYSCAGIPGAIWFKRRMVTDILDGIVYGLLIGGIFAFFWPK